MSEKRFRFLVKYLSLDELAPIRDIFTFMVENFQKYFCVSEYVGETSVKRIAGQSK